MTEERAELSLAELGKALDRLGEVLARPADEPFVTDATIQRFEFTFELLWKTLKRFLALQGVHTNFPKDTLRAAYSGGWIDDEKLWLDMLRDRNVTSHVYREEVALRIYAKIRAYYPHLRRTFEQLCGKFGEAQQ